MPNTNVKLRLEYTVKVSKNLFRDCLDNHTVEIDLSVLNDDLLKAYAVSLLGPDWTQVQVTVYDMDGNFIHEIRFWK